MISLSVIGGFRRGGSSRKVVVSRLIAAGSSPRGMWMIWCECNDHTSTGAPRTLTAADLTLTVFEEDRRGMKCRPGPRLGSVNCRSLFSFRAEFVLSSWSSIMARLSNSCRLLLVLLSLSEIQMLLRHVLKKIDWGFKLRGYFAEFLREHCDLVSFRKE